MWTKRFPFVSNDVGPVLLWFCAVVCVCLVFFLEDSSKIIFPFEKHSSLSYFRKYGVQATGAQYFTLPRSAQRKMKAVWSRQAVVASYHWVLTVQQSMNTQFYLLMWNLTRKKNRPSLSQGYEINLWNDHMAIYVLVQLKLMWHNILFSSSAWLNFIFIANIN